MARQVGSRAGVALAAESDVVLRDGSALRMRPVRPEDEARLREFLERLSPEARELRFFSASANLAGEARRAAAVGYPDSFGLVAVAGAGEAIVAHAGYWRIDDERAEIAFEVADELRGRGLATILMAHLAQLAGASGVRTFEAWVLPENRRMIEVFRESGFPVRTRLSSDGMKVELPTAFSEETVERFEGREHVAAAIAAARVLRPASVAVVGASRRRGTVGGEVFANLLASGFDGPIYPVNRDAERVQGVTAYRSIAEVPDDPELAVVAVPADAVPGVARECASGGVRALVVLSAGFAEAGEDGVRRQEELMAICRAAGMRLVGPNCLGVLDTRSRLNATFAPTDPPRGGVALMSQSGAVGLALMEHAVERGIGLSSFVSAGNKADLSGNDFLEHWQDDDATRVVLLYLESFGNPRRFARIARRTALRKPVVAVKAGASAAGARAAASHTGALVQASDVGVDALFRQAGVIRVGALEELFDVAALLSSQPMPRGRRVAIVTNSGGPAILCADACQAAGLDVPELPEPLRRLLGTALPPFASTRNPVDMLAEAGPDQYAHAVAALGASGAVDALVVIFTPALGAGPEEIERAVAEASTGLDVPVLTAFLREGGGRPRPWAPPRYAWPEGAVRALANAVKYSAWRREPQGTVPELEHVRGEDARTLLVGAVAEGARWLRPEETAELLDCYGLPVADWRYASSPEEAGCEAAGLGGRVALKGAAATIVHKTEHGAIELGLEGESAVREAAEGMAERLRGAGHELEGFVVQRQVPAGVEMLAGVTGDPVFGPLVACGAGGTAAELIRDVAVSITPVTDRGATAMVRSLATFPLLDGWRGAPRADVAALEDVLLRLGAIAEAHPEVAELDCNPVIVHEHGAVVVDARVRVAPPPARPAWPARGAQLPLTRRDSRSSY